MECCKIHFDYSLYFIFVYPVVKCGKGRLMLLNVTFVDTAMYRSGATSGKIRVGFDICQNIFFMHVRLT